MDLSNYDYFLPEANLALEPAVPRDSSKLFIYNTEKDQIIFDSFFNIDKYLPNNSFMVLNNTKVLPARVTMTRLHQGYGGQEKGIVGKVVVLLLVNEITNNTLPIIVDRKINVGEKISFDNDNYLHVIGQKENIFEVRFDFSRQHLFSLLNKYGAMPIPPYLKKSTLSKDDLLKKYQTIFAKTDGSAAAPTASLHFTDSVFKKLDEKEIRRLFVTLHVGLGTFAPITNENIKRKKLHEEYYKVDVNTWKQIMINREGPPSLKLRRVKKKLVAVGTTVVRTLESIARQRVFSSATPPRGPLAIPQKQLSSLFNSQFSIHNSKLINKTDLFIFPPYDFKMVDIMITNFHLPKSSLMMLVEAFLEDKYKKAPPSLKLRRAGKKSLVELYNIAIKNNFRFYSFGDAMLIL